MEKEKFYQLCAVALGTEHKFKEINYTKRWSNRWGPREPGNGRFPNFGIIRWYGPTMIHMSLVHPESITRTFSSPDAALAFLDTLREPG